MKRLIAGILLLVACCALRGLAQVKATRVRVAENVMQGMLIKKVDPQPASGDAAHIRSEVVLKVIVGRDGSIESLQAVNGHPMLIPTAIEAVKQWKYKPYLLNGAPWSVETTIRVDFPVSAADAKKPPSAKEK